MLLDLFCGAGGAAVGYWRAGFDVVGVDIAPQPHYPFEFHQADAMTYPLDGYDAIHASPPCHDHSPVTGRNRKAVGVKGTGWMLAATVQRLAGANVPWVVENVDSARTFAGAHVVRLCGSSFGLDVRRHRLFATNLAVFVPPCDHGWQTPRFRSLDYTRRDVLASVVGVHGHLNYAGEDQIRNAAMGIDWNDSARARPGDPAGVHRAHRPSTPRAPRSVRVTRDLELLIAAMKAYDAVMRRHACSDCGAAWDGENAECSWCAEAERRLIEDQREALLHPDWMVDQGVRYHELDPVDQHIWCQTRGIPTTSGPVEFWAGRLRRAVASGLVTMHEADLALARYDRWQRRAVAA